MQTMAESACHRFLQTYARLVTRLCRQANLGRWGLSQASFAQALWRSASHRFRHESPTVAEVAAYLNRLHLDDLALACACAEGLEAAWEHFICAYRSDLRRAACAIAGSAAGVDLADSLYAELYGLDERGGERRSLFTYYCGRSQLMTWLRAVMAQRNVDRVRASRRLDSLDSATSTGCLPDRVASSAASEPDPDEARLAALVRNAARKAISALQPDARLRLAYYYGRELTLAQIGVLLGEHEATVSRKLDRTRRQLREAIVGTLRRRHRLSDADVAAAVSAAVARRVERELPESSEGVG